jgi:hypothetical protein
MVFPYTTDYTNRQVDIELLQSVSVPKQLQQVTIGGTVDPIKIVTGVQKLIQRYTSLLLQVLESVHFDQDQGTELLPQITQGFVQTAGALQGTFAVANRLVLEQLNRDDANDDFGDQPDDEILETAVLIDYDIDFASSTVYLTIQLTTVAGDDVVFVVPTTAPR